MTQFHSRFSPCVTPVLHARKQTPFTRRAVTWRVMTWTDVMKTWRWTPPEPQLVTAWTMVNERVCDWCPAADGIRQNQSRVADMHVRLAYREAAHMNQTQHSASLITHKHLLGWPWSQIIFAGIISVVSRTRTRRCVMTSGLHMSWLLPLVFAEAVSLVLRHPWQAFPVLCALLVDVVYVDHNV